MVESEREMLREKKPEPSADEPFTSLQPTYEDSVPPHLDDWGFEQD